VDTAFSFGIATNESWDVDIASRGVTVYQFDHTVDVPINDNLHLIFAKKKISTDFFVGPESESLPSLIAQHDKHDPRPNIILKMDIENAEWDFLDTTPSGATRPVYTDCSRISLFPGSCRTTLAGTLRPCAEEVVRSL
jgi:hypothetical protein